MECQLSYVDRDCALLLLTVAAAQLDPTAGPPKQGRKGPAGDMSHSS